MKELSEMKLLIEKLEKMIPPRPAKTESEFIQGEWVQVRDDDGDPWVLCRFVSFGVGLGDYPYKTDSDGNEDEWWKHCRLPVDVPGILVRHTGGGCQVSDKDVKVLAILWNGHTNIAKASGWEWSHILGDSSIKAYMILPGWLNK